MFASHVHTRPSSLRSLAFAVNINCSRWTFGNWVLIKRASLHKTRTARRTHTHSHAHTIHWWLTRSGQAAPSVTACRHIQIHARIIDTNNPCERHSNNVCPIRGLHTCVCVWVCSPLNCAYCLLTEPFAEPHSRGRSAQHSRSHVVIRNVYTRLRWGKVSRGEVCVCVCLCNFFLCSFLWQTGYLAVHARAHRSQPRICAVRILCEFMPAARHEHTHAYTHKHHRRACITGKTVYFAHFRLLVICCYQIWRLNFCITVVEINWACKYILLEWIR